MKNCIKNLAFNTILSLAEQVEIQKGQVISKTLAQNDAVSITTGYASATSTCGICERSV